MSKIAPLRKLFPISYRKFCTPFYYIYDVFLFVFCLFEVFYYVFSPIFVFVFVWVL